MFRKQGCLCLAFVALCLCGMQAVAAEFHVSPRGDALEAWLEP
jgi:hypothetical protein